MKSEVEQFWNESFDLEREHGFELLSGSLRGFKASGQAAKEDAAAKEKPSKTKYAFVGFHSADRKWVATLEDGFKSYGVKWKSDVIDGPFGDNWGRHIHKLLEADAAFVVLSGISFPEWDNHDLLAMSYVAKMAQKNLCFILMPGVGSKWRSTLLRAPNAYVMDCTEVLGKSALRRMIHEQLNMVLFSAVHHRSLEVK